VTLFITIGGDRLLATSATLSSRWFDSGAVVSRCNSEAAETMGGLKTSGRSSSEARAAKRFGDMKALRVFTLGLGLGDEEDDRFRFVDSEVRA